MPVLELVPIVTAANKASSFDLPPSSDHMMCFHKGHVVGVLDGEALDWLHNRLSNDYKLSMY